MQQQLELQICCRAGTWGKAFQKSIRTYSDISNMKMPKCTYQSLIRSYEVNVLKEFWGRSLLRTVRLQQLNTGPQIPEDLCLAQQPESLIDPHQRFVQWCTKANHRALQRSLQGEHHTISSGSHDDLCKQWKAETAHEMNSAKLFWHVIHVIQSTERSKNI